MLHEDLFDLYKNLWAQKSGTGGCHGGSLEILRAHESERVTAACSNPLMWALGQLMFL